MQAHILLNCHGVVNSRKHVKFSNSFYVILALILALKTAIKNHKF